MRLRGFGLPLTVTCAAAVLLTIVYLLGPSVVSWFSTGSGSAPRGEIDPARLKRDSRAATIIRGLIITNRDPSVRDQAIALMKTGFSPNESVAEAFFRKCGKPEACPLTRGRSGRWIFYIERGKPAEISFVKGEFRLSWTFGSGKTSEEIRKQMEKK